MIIINIIILMAIVLISISNSVFIDLIVIIIIVCSANSINNALIIIKNIISNVIIIIIKALKLYYDSMYVNIVKANAVGQTAYKVNLPSSAPTTTKNYYPTGTRHVIKRARSGGCVAPKKKGAIENTSLRNGQVCAWGSIVRPNY
jgi:hypothetical protein